MKPYYEKDGIVIFHGDCREVLPLLVPESVTLLWSDPPYGHMNQDGDLQSARVGIKGARQREAVAIQNDSTLDMRLVVDSALSLSVPLLRRDCCCCCCCCGGGGPSPSFAWLAERMDRQGLSFFHAVVWDKTARGPGMGWRFRRDYEMMMVAHRTGGKLAWRQERAFSNILRVAPVPNDLHPTTKPEGLPGAFIEWTTAPDDLVLDCFMGSGTTLVASIQRNRRAIGIEIEEKYCEIAAKRLENTTPSLFSEAI